jgi:transcriptional regulator with XRE-family HTH domain
LILLAEELDPVEIAGRIRAAMALARLTAVQLADLMEVHRNTIGNWTRRESPMIPWDRMGELAAVLGTTKEELLHGEQMPLSPSAQTEIAALRESIEQVRRLLEERLPPESR